MILVVIAHVALFNFGVDTSKNSNFHYYLQQFRMPLFFFVSGFVFYKKDFVWNLTNTISFLKKKISVQIIAPFIFLLTFIYINDIGFINAITNPTKNGFWFTFTLFEFFLFYIIIQKVISLFKFNNAKIEDYIILSCGVLSLFIYKFLKIISITPEIAGFMGAINFCYFIFFIIGTLTKKHFNRIELTLDKTETISILIILYFTLNIFGGPLKYMAGIGRIFELILNISGVFIVFSFFRKFEYIFTKNTYFANILKFIGKRTLDIYLLHYFFISYNLPEIFPYFKNNNLPLIEFTCSIIMAVLIIIACLTISSIIRLSPTLGHFLFGAKK